MVKSQTTMQDPFLNELRKEKVPVAIFLLNGLKLLGQIEAFDQYVVVLKSKQTQLIYKHAISTIVPAHLVGRDVVDSRQSSKCNEA